MVVAVVVVVVVVIIIVVVGNDRVTTLGDLAKSSF